MTYIQCPPSQPQLLAVSKLEKSPLNVRRTAASTGLAELKASLLAHGLMQNLVVTDSGDGTYRVIAGGRRLEAIHMLQAEGKLPEDFAVACQIVTESHAREMSLAENTVRLAMHPADQFEAFAALIDQGESASDVAQRFGIEESLVHKRMKLARVAPALLMEYRSEGLTLEGLMAFTVTDDHKRQLKVFKSLPNWQKDDPAAIRAALTEKMAEASSKLARFVGLEAYQAAGGVSRADLFGEEVYLEKPALLNRLALQKLDGIRRELEAEGWAWTQIHPDRDYTLINRCTRIRPQLIDAPCELLAALQQLKSEQEAIAAALDETESDALLDQQQVVSDRLDEMENTLAAFVGFDADQKALAGCVVSIGQDGTPFLDKGLVKPEQRKQLARLLKTENDVSAASQPKGELPRTLCHDLAVSRLQVAQVELAKHPQIALDLLVFQVASTMLANHRIPDGPDVLFRLPRLLPAKASASPIAADAFAAIAKFLPLDWLKPETAAARFAAFRGLADTAKLDVLAYCVALTLKPKLAPAKSEDLSAYEVALSLTNAHVAAYWRPTKANFLSRISRDQLLAMGREVLGDAWAQSRSRDKKASLVEQFDRAFTRPDTSGRVKEQIETLKRWLPTGMAFGSLPPQSPVPAKKSRKAA